MEFSKDPRVSGNTPLKQQIIGEDLFSLQAEKVDRRFLAVAEIGDSFRILVRLSESRRLSAKYIENLRTGEVFVLEVNNLPNDSID